jgi:hypothetical protein
MFYPYSPHRVLMIASGIVASIIRTVVFARTDPVVDVTCKCILGSSQADNHAHRHSVTHANLVNWSIIEPGMYLLAACALSFKPLFRMFAKALHLDTFVTHTGNTGIHNTTPSKTRSRSISRSTTQSEIQMETMKVMKNGGFSELSKGRDEKADKRAMHEQKGSLQVMVTTTWEMDIESRSLYEVSKSKDFA